MRSLHALLLLLVTTVWSATARAAGPDKADISFAEHLFRPYDIKLLGLTPIQSVSFPRPHAWQLLKDPELFLDLSHSETLLPDRSTLTVLLNGSPVGSVMLTPDNVRGDTIVLPLPRANLEDYNYVTFQVSQHIAETVQDPFDPSLWTRIGRESFIRFHYRARAIEPDLSMWPYPMYDTLGYGPLELTLVGPSNVSAATVEALSHLSMSLGRIADYRGVQIHPPVATVDQAKTAALVIGTLGENPEIERLVDTSQLKGGEGLLAVSANPADPSLPVLVVTGTTVQSLRSAVYALASDNRTQVLAGPRVIVYEGGPDDLLPSRREPRPVQGQDEFTMAEIGLSDTTVRGLYSGSVRIPIRLEGDAKIRRYGALATIRYGYGAMLDTSISNMEIRVNGVAVDSLPLDNPSGAERLTHRLQLPSHILTPDSMVEVAFNLFPDDYDIRHANNDRTIWATVYADTSFEIPRDRYADVPDLSRLRFDAWPFTLEPGRGATTIVLPDRPTRADASAAIELGAHLGYASVATDPDLMVTVASPQLDMAIDGRHGIFLVGGQPHSNYQGLLTHGLVGHTARSAGLLPQEAPSMRSEASTTVIEQLVDPSDPSHVKMILKAPSSDELLDLIDHISDPKLVLRLEGNAALIDGREIVNTVDVADKVRLGRPSLTGRVQAIPWEDHWLALGSLVLAFLFMAAATLRVWARNWGGEVE